MSVGFDRSKDRDYVGQSYNHAVSLLDEMEPLLKGGPAQAQELHAAARLGLRNAQTTLSSAEAEVDRILGNTSIPFQGRYDQASAIYAKTRETVQHELGRIEVGGRHMPDVLLTDALPKFTGTEAEQAFLRDEIRHIIGTGDVTEGLAKLARDPSYAPLVLGRFGRSLLMERGMKEREVNEWHSAVRHEALLVAAETNRDVAGRVEAGDKMQGVYAEAAIAFTSRLDAMGANIDALGRGIAHDRAVAQKVEQRARRIG